MLNEFEINYPSINIMTGNQSYWEQNHAAAWTTYTVREERNYQPQYNSNWVGADQSDYSIKVWLGEVDTAPIGYNGTPTYVRNVTVFLEVAD